MKNFLFSLPLLLPLSLVAQDLIVTTAGDSIECYIVLSQKDYIYYAIDEKPQPIIPREKVASWVYSYFYRPRVNGKLTRKLIKSFESPYVTKGYPISIGIRYGAARVIGANPSGNLDSYYKRLSTGRNLGVDLSYYFNQSFGLIGGFSQFAGSASETNVWVTWPDGYRVRGDIHEKNRTDFFGLGFCYKTASKLNTPYWETSSFFMFGYVQHSGLSTFVDRTLASSGKTYGSLYSVDFKRFVSPQLSLSFGFGWQMAVLRKVDLKYANGETETLDLKRNEYVSLTRYNFNVGVNYHIGRQRPELITTY